MTTEAQIKQQIYQLIDALPVERLPGLLGFLKYLLQPVKFTPMPTAGAAPIYQVYREAIDTGIPDLAAHHDHYLYGVGKNEA